MNATALDNGGPDDDIFGSSRSYGSSFCGGNGGAIVAKARPTMISAKYRLKEERRKVLKISINKLKKIEDMESSLRRSVLINNTIKRLQREAKEEKLQKQQLHSYPRCYTPYKTSSFSKDSSGMLTSLASKSLRQDIVPNDADKENTSQNTSRNSPLLPIESRGDSLLMASELDVSRGCDEEVASLSPSTDCNAPIISKKRSIEEVEDCDVQDVLSQFYMPPTPRMLTSIDDTDDEDEDVNVVDIDVPPCTPATPDCCKRPKLEIPDTKSDVPPILCDRLRLDERTLPGDANVTTKNLEDSEDIEVVLEDKEDVERRLLLCSGGTTISRTSVTEDQCWVNSRTISGGSTCTLLPSPSDMLVEDCTTDSSDPNLRLSCSNSSPVLLPTQSDVLTEHDSNVTRLCSAPSLSTVLSSSSGMDIDDCSATNHPVLHIGCVPTCNIHPSTSDMLVEESLPSSVDSHCDLRLGYSVPSSNVLSSQPELLVPVNNTTQSSERLRLDSSPSSCALLPSSAGDMVVEESNMIGAGKHQTLRLGSNPFVASSFCGSIDGSAIGGSSANNCPPMALDPTEQHQYSCGHASIFGELQSVVFHSLITSLES